MSALSSSVTLVWGRLVRFYSFNRLFRVSLEIVIPSSLLILCHVFICQAIFKPDRDDNLMALEIDSGWRHCWLSDTLINIHGNSDCYLYLMIFTLAYLETCTATWLNITSGFLMLWWCCGAVACLARPESFWYTRAYCPPSSMANRRYLQRLPLASFHPHRHYHTVALR